MFWLHRRSEEPSLTSQVCYWKKSALTKVARDAKYDIGSILKKNIPPLPNKGESFLQAVLDTCKEADGGVFDICRKQQFENASLHKMCVDFSMTFNEIKSHTATAFVEFMKGKYIIL